MPDKADNQSKSPRTGKAQINAAADFEGKLVLSKKSHIPEEFRHFSRTGFPGFVCYQNVVRLVYQSWPGTGRPGLP